MDDNLRRGSARHNLYAPYSPMLRWTGLTGEHDGCITEISLNGCFLNTRGEATVGEIITFRTQLSSGEKVELRAQAVHHDKKLLGYGLRFVYTAPEERMFVAQLVAEATDAAKNNGP